MTKLTLKFISYVFHKSPPWLLDFFANLLAFLAFDVFSFRKKLCLKNLKIIRPDIDSKSKEASDIVRNSYKSLILTGMELFAGKYQNISQNCEGINLHYVLDAMKLNQGCYVLCTHTGNWEALAGFVCQNVSESYVPVKKVGGKQFNQYITEIRRSYGLFTKERKTKGDSTEIIRNFIANKHLVGFMQDQSRPGSPLLDFFGVPAKTSLSMAAIIRKNRAPVIPALAVRLSPKVHQIVFFPELKLQYSDDEKNDIIENTKIMNQAAEQLILKNTSQYLLLHDRWK